MRASRRVFAARPTKTLRDARKLAPQGAGGAARQVARQGAGGDARKVARQGAGGDARKVAPQGAGGDARKVAPQGAGGIAPELAPRYLRPGGRRGLRGNHRSLRRPELAEAVTKGPGEMRRESIEARRSRPRFFVACLGLAAFASGPRARDLADLSDQGAGGGESDADVDRGFDGTLRSVPPVCRRITSMCFT